MTQIFPDTIPIFPLAGAVLLPRARLPLHIFEPRYLSMIDDCLKAPERLIGMVQPAGSPGGAGKTLAAIGCAGRLTGFSETEDGRYMITLTGQSRFRLGVEVLGGFQAYRRFGVDWRGFDRDRGMAEDDPKMDRPVLVSLVSRYLRHRNLDADWSDLSGAEDEMLINTLSILLPFGAAEKQSLIEAPSLANRRETLIALLTYELTSFSSGPGEGLLQ